MRVAVIFSPILNRLRGIIVTEVTTKLKTSNIGKTRLNKNRQLKRMLSSWQLYLLMSVPFFYVILFKYLPMYGVTIAFKNYMPLKGVLGSPWAGLVHFKTFFNSAYFSVLIKNTMILSIYGLLAGFPFPIILALALNYVGKERFKKLVQMTTYIPHFISTVVIVGLMNQILSLRTGVVNNLIEMLGGERINFIANPDTFRHLYVWSGVWQGIGWGSIIYIAALAGIDPQLHEAAIMDGASKLRRIWHIDIPGITPTVVIMLILSVGHILNTGFEKVYLMTNPLNSSTAEVIDTYVYKVGIAGQFPNYSFSTAVGLFQSVVTLVLTIAVNQISKKVTENSLW